MNSILHNLGKRWMFRKYYGGRLSWWQHIYVWFWERLR